MSDRAVVAVFAKSEELCGAVSALRAEGLTLRDCYTPYAVHGLDEAMGLRPSRLAWACFGYGLCGTAFMMWFQLWTSAVDWRLNVGGRPWNSSLSFACVAFEVMVLLAGLGTVATFLWLAGLRPWRKPRWPVPEVTDDRFALVVEPGGAVWDSAAIERLLEGYHPVWVEEILASEESA